MSPLSFKVPLSLTTLVQSMAYPVPSRTRLHGGRLLLPLGQLGQAVFCFFVFFNYF